MVELVNVRDERKAKMASYRSKLAKLQNEAEEMKRRRCAECHPVRLVTDNHGGFGAQTVCPWPRKCAGPVAEQPESTGVRS